MERRETIIDVTKLAHMEISTMINRYIRAVIASLAWNRKHRKVTNATAMLAVKHCATARQNL
jgi:hypothetical protein